MFKLKRLVGYDSIEFDDGTHVGGESFRGWGVVNEKDQVISINSVSYHLYKQQWQAIQAVDRLNGKSVPEIKFIRGEDLFKVRVGQMVVSVTGPGQHPSPGLCSRIGVVVGCEKHRFGVSLEVEWNGQQVIDSVDVLQDPEFARGTGVYAYPSLRLAIG